MATPKFTHPWSDIVTNELLTIEQMQTRFNGEWILVQDPEQNAQHQIQAGRVVCHSKDRDEVYRQAILHRPSSFAVVYTGAMPENTAIVL